MSETTTLTGRTEQPPPPESIGTLLSRAARTFADRPFLEAADGTTLSYADAAARVASGAARLRNLGLGVGDRVGICLPNDISWPLAWLAVLSGGHVAVPINRTYKAADIGHVLDDAEPSVVVTSRDLAAGFDQQTTGTTAPVVLVDDLFGPGTAVDGEPAEFHPVADGSLLGNLQYTSGTSGLPKACMLTHEYWIGVGRAMGEAFELTDADRLITSQPFSYMDPMWLVSMSLQYGAPLVILPRFSASGFWPDVRKHRATVLYVLGSMPQMLLRQPPSWEDTRNDVRLVLCSAIPAASHRELEARWDAPWREAYGLTESGLNIAAPLADPRSVGSGLLGVPSPGWRVRIVDEGGADVPSGVKGEIVLSGPTLMTGYWRRPEATATTLRDGWFHTGDVGIRQEDGWIRLVGRLKDSIRRGGENIATAEVEEALRELPFVRDCAVVGVEDPLFGQEVKAHVEIDESVELSGLAAQIEEHARRQLAPFKVPRYLAFWRSLPRTPSERIAKHKIADHPRDELMLTVDLGQRGARKP